MNLAGKFIVVDGPDGGGKGTQLARLERSIAVAGGSVVRAKDPGGTEIGERIRHLLLLEENPGMDPRCEALLFMASRAQLIAEVVRPALEAGKTVLCDRFISATYAYQGAAGFPVEQVLTLGGMAVGGIWPDLTLILDLEPELGFSRTGRAPSVSRRRSAALRGQMAMFDGAVVDAIEQRPIEYHRRVRQLFRSLPDRYPGRVVLIDASPDADRVEAEVQGALRSTFP
ncbi:MAG: dTMP kinase [Planctomycetia bacterium]|nr:MAG: dTMP kinase [Planctomycetia bacterium]